MKYCDVFNEISIEFYRNNIVAFCEDFFDFKLNNIQKDVLVKIQNDKYVKDFLFRGEGSTFVLCLASLWYVCLHHQAKVIITDGFNNQEILDNQVWLEMKKCYNHFLLNELFEKTNDFIELKEGKKCWFINKRRCEHENMMGVIANNVMIACDNAKYLDRITYDAMLSTIVTPTSKLLLLG